MKPRTLHELLDWHRARDRISTKCIDLIAAYQSNRAAPIAKLARATQAKLREMEDDDTK